ncbi:XRE family transcriptional regulator [Barnesiella viscericola]|uniref:XRE family transcriptional regulator n=1 Tax=Barnesiella viscericola TaxID=397865 RepID=UPI002352D488|nr:XRE family transcriptional regulator [Barnesiella viscericola]
MKPIGELIRERLKAEERSVTWFARKLSCSRANVYKIFRKEYIDTELLTRISRILDYDFFQYFSDRLKEE